jgi:hypothetical protein
LSVFSERGYFILGHYSGWKSYTGFFSADYCQAFLKNSYQQKNLENSEKKSYENCYAFLYYIEHGQIYYKQAERAPLVLKPILLFYGLVQLIKACILTIDPAYPETTTVLAHGVSTRKKKKQNYQFFQDEVKFQKNGLFPFMSEKMFHLEQLEGKKVIMEELFQLIPELDELFFFLEGKRTFTKLAAHGEQFMVPEIILDQYHMSKNRLKDFLTSKFEEPIAFSNDGLTFKMNNLTLKGTSPIKYHLEGDFYAFPLKKGDFFHFPELLIHYLLLYNLSMIARYETEWWSELTKMMPNKDYPFIHSFLDITLQKGPFLVYQYLTSE